MSYQRGHNHILDNTLNLINTRRVLIRKFPNVMPGRAKIRSPHVRLVLYSEINGLSFASYLEMMIDVTPK
ncbi:unnamed protein product [Rhizophagus irregularis]|nr:unnamed protein product [Rhizophagus irregularis]